MHGVDMFVLWLTFWHADTSRPLLTVVQQKKCKLKGQIVLQVQCAQCMQSCAVCSVQSVHHYILLFVQYAHSAQCAECKMHRLQSLQCAKCARLCPNAGQTWCLKQMCVVCVQMELLGLRPVGSPSPLGVPPPPQPIPDLSMTSAMLQKALKGQEEMTSAMLQKALVSQEEDFLPSKSKLASSSMEFVLDAQGVSLPSSEHGGLDSVSDDKVPSLPTQPFGITAQTAIKAHPKEGAASPSATYTLTDWAKPGSSPTPTTTVITPKATLLPSSQPSTDEDGAPMLMAPSPYFHDPVSLDCECSCMLLPPSYVYWTRVWQHLHRGSCKLLIGVGGSSKPGEGRESSQGSNALIDGDVQTGRC